MRYLNYYIVSILLIIWTPLPINACSCIGPTYGFLIPDGAILPSNAIGVPFWGRKEWIFTVERITSKGREQISYETSYAENEELLGPNKAVIMITPEGGFIPGETYCFALGKTQLNISIRDEIITNHNLSISIVKDDMRVSDLKVVNFSGSCSSKIKASQIKMTTLMTEPYQEYRNSFLYFWQIEGDIWRPRNHLCHFVPPGCSWVGQGEEIIFSACNHDKYNIKYNDQKRKFLESGLTPGSHIVKVTAWLPGTNLSAFALTTVDLFCE